MNKSYHFISIDQPVGTMYLVKMNASEVIKISESKERTAYNNDHGIQRRLEKNRTDSISSFCQKSDAMFPTPIILSASSNDFVLNEDMRTLTYNDNSLERYCSIVDGQHRLAGIDKSGKADQFELLVLFVFDTDPSRDAYLFSIINSNQKPVSKSLVYDLYGLTKARTVEKLCNKVMRELNTNEESQMKGRIKLLGYKDNLSPNATVSQATMIDSLKKLITSDASKDNIDIELGNKLSELDSKRYILRDWFIDGEDKKIIDENQMYFNAWISNLNKLKIELSKESFLLFEKSIGFIASYQLFRILFLVTEVNKINRIDYYNDSLRDIFTYFFESNLDKKEYGSSLQGAKKLFYDLVSCAILTQKLDLNEAFFTNNDITNINISMNEIQDFRNRSV